MSSWRKVGRTATYNGNPQAWQQVLTRWKRGDQTIEVSHWHPPPGYLGR